MRKLFFLLLVLGVGFNSVANDSLPKDTLEKNLPDTSAEKTEIDTAEKSGKKLVYKIDIKEGIAPPVWRRMKKGLVDAREKEADLILIHMNTYGGMVKTADSMRTRLLNSEIPVIVFIDNNAASAGALISIACDSIYMRKGGNIGAATVVNKDKEAMPDKYQSYMRSTMRSTANAQGRDPRIAEAMVDPDIQVKGVVDTGKVLTFTTREAMENGFCEGMHETVEDVINAYGFEEYEMAQYKPTVADKIISVLISPFLNGILIMLIIGGLYFELQSPGVGFPLIIAITAAILYFAPLYLEGLASNWEILLFIAGLILMAVEIFAVPGFGVPGISGILLLVTGLTLSMVNNVIFDFTTVKLNGVVQAFFIVVISTFAALLLSYFLSIRLFARETKKFGNLALQGELTAETGYTSAEDDKKSVVGKRGKAYTVLRPAGKIEIGEDIFDATVENGYIEKGEEVEIVSYHNAQLIVDRPFDEE